MSLPDIPTAITPNEAKRLEELATDRVVLEVGSLLGFSTVVMGRVATKMLSIDPHEGYPCSSPRSTLTAFEGNLDRYGVRDRVKAYNASYESVIPHLPTKAFDLAFIDITGEFNDTIKAMWLCWPMLLSSGVLAVHDYKVPEWPGATEAIEDFSQTFNRSFEVVDTLAVFS